MKKKNGNKTRDDDDDDISLEEDGNKGNLIVIFHISFSKLKEKSSYYMFG